jgi:hypothetical protein
MTWKNCLDGRLWLLSDAWWVGYLAFAGKWDHLLRIDRFVTVKGTIFSLHLPHGSTLFCFQISVMQRPMTWLSWLLTMTQTSAYFGIIWDLLKLKYVWNIRKKLYEMFTVLGHCDLVPSFHPTESADIIPNRYLWSPYQVVARITRSLLYHSLPSPALVPLSTHVHEITCYLQQSSYENYQQQLKW